MDDSVSLGPDSFRLENIRGPRLSLKPHPEACAHAHLGEYHREHSERPLAVDLFSGAGGLSLGLQRAGFRLILAADQNPWATETHAAYFPGTSVRADISNESALDELLEPLRGRRIDLLAGGPPCQPFSKPARWIRSVHADGVGSLRDSRRELWRLFLYATELLRPSAVLIENVTDIATNEDGITLRAIFSRLEQLGYFFDCRTYFAYDLGVPQHRQRLFIVAFKGSARPFDWPERRPVRPNLRDAIADLPPLNGGWNEVPPPYGGPITDLQRSFREGCSNNDLSLWDHVTRAVRGDDLIAFGLLTHKTKYYELPTELRRYGAESFVDKYKRLSWDEPCRGITAHMGKDGYWYIHPEQHRSLSIREAARVQSFPDWFRFAGFRTSGLRQIGEAVPPFVAEALGRRLIKHLGLIASEVAPRGTQRLRDKHMQVRQLLGSWYEREARDNSIHPWRLEPGLWTNLMGEILFGERAHRPKALLFWHNYLRDWPDPKSFLRDRHRESHLRTIGQTSRLPVLEALAHYLSRSRAPSWKELAKLGLNERLVRRAMTVSGYSHERPNDSALVRVATRVFERTKLPELMTEGQIATAMLVGEDEGAILYSAAIELGETICSTSEPACLLCPISKVCAHYVSSGE
jgi:DNA (cytosine-5)-methyltransferase 1